MHREAQQRTPTSAHIYFKGTKPGKQVSKGHLCSYHILVFDSWNRLDCGCFLREKVSGVLWRGAGSLPVLSAFCSLATSTAGHFKAPVGVTEQRAGKGWVRRLLRIKASASGIPEEEYRLMVPRWAWAWPGLLRSSSCHLLALWCGQAYQTHYFFRVFNFEV